MSITTAPFPTIQHDGETSSNDFRRKAAESEPKCLRTYTPSLAILEKSAGCYHWTPEGRKLADFTSGVLVANLGHNPVGWWRKFLDYLQVDTSAIGEPADGFFSGLALCAYNAVTPMEIQATQRLLANLQGQPGGGRCEQVLWAASGSEAIQKAIWAAMGWHQREGRADGPILLATRGGFHGKKGLAGAITGDENDPERDPRVKFIAFPKEECTSVQRRRQPIDLAPYREELDQLANDYGDRLCCLVTEPYLGGGGSFHPQPEYLQLVQQFCRQHNIVFILDEIQSNFGRTGPMYAFTHYGVEPDIVALGKGLGNGAPVSAAVGRADLLGGMEYGAGSDTYSANSLACAAVLATLDEFENSNVLAHARQLSSVIEAGLLRLTELDIVAAIRGEGMVWGVECAAVGGLSAAQAANRCVEKCYHGDSQGRALHLLGPLAGKVIRVSPPLVMPLAEAEEYLELMYQLFAAACEV